MSDALPADRSTNREDHKMESPYGEAPLVAWAMFTTWNLFFSAANLASLQWYEAIIHPSIEDQSFLALSRSFTYFWSIHAAVWFAIVILQYAVIYGLWKPKKWARNAGITSLGLGLIMSTAMLLTSTTIADPILLHVGSESGVPTDGIFPVVLNTIAFLIGWNFLNKPETRNYIESEGYVKAKRFIPLIRRPDAGGEKGPESVAWIAEAKCEGQIYLNEDHLVIVKSRDKKVIDIPINDIVKLERGKMTRFDAAELIAAGLASPMALPAAYTTIPTLKITYSTKTAQTSTITLAAEQKICPKCGRKVSHVAAGWYCMKDDYLLDPTTKDLAEIIMSKRPEKTAKKDTYYF